MGNSSNGASAWSCDKSKCAHLFSLFKTVLFSICYRGTVSNSTCLLCTCNLHIRPCQRIFYSRLVTNTVRKQDALGHSENVSRLFFLSPLPAVSSSCPCLLRVKIEVLTDTFSLLKHAFREACSAVNWFAYRRLERYHGRFAAVSAFSFKHPFLERVESPLLAISWNWKCKLSIITDTLSATQLKVSVQSESTFHSGKLGSIQTRYYQKGVFHIFQK